MITYQRSRTGPIIAAVVAVAALGAGAYWWMGSGGLAGRDGVVVNNANQGGAGGWLKPGVGDEPQMSLKPEIASDGRPSDVTADDWTALKNALAKVNASKEEADRIVSYLRYQRGFEMWQTLDPTKDGQRRHDMAQELLNDLPGRLQTGEFTPIESNLMAAVLLADLETDETKRNQMLEQWQAKLNAISPMSEDEQKTLAQARETELKRRMATAFGDWESKTQAADRTPAKLEQALLEVQRAYNAGGF